jgi:D-xylose 1-dehydrogenase (NADP+, D-xylono-1,5-lactone-forming)
MSEKLNWGVMGNATIARVCVIPAIQKSRNGTVRALASRSPQGAAEVSRKNNIIRIHGDYHALIEDPAIEAIYIPLPNHLHYEWTLKALAAGKHVLCEKPLACNARQAETMAAAAQSAGRLLMEAFMYRFHPRSRQIQKLVDAGEIGTPRLIRSAFCYRMAAKDYENPNNARLKPEMGGGALLDVGCYGVSVARWLYGSEPLQVQCQACYHSGGVDLHVTGMLKFDNDRLATLEASFVTALQQTFNVGGEKGAVELPHDAFIPWEKDTLYTLRQKDGETARPTVVPGADEYQLMVEHFVDAIRGDTSLEYSPSDSIGNMRALDALAAAARTGETVRI